MVKLVTDTNLEAAVAALVAGSPGALDTLNELAAALGDDANFAATVTTALGNRLTWRGAWAAGANYVANDLVTNNGGLYKAPNSFTSGGAFNPANWVQLVAPTGTYALPSKVERSQMRAGALLRRPPAFNRASWPAQISDGTLLAHNSRRRYIALKSGSLPQPLFVNATFNEHDTPIVTNPIVVRAAIELPDSTIWPLYFRGQRDTTIEPHGAVLADPIGLDFAAGDIIYVRTWVRVSQSGYTIPLISSSWINYGEGGDSVTNYTDKTLAGSFSTTPVNIYGPVVVLGTFSPLDVVQVCAAGDSITGGTGDLPATGLSDLGAGFVDRAMNNTIPFVKLPISGASAANFTSPLYRRVRTQMMPGCTHAIAAFGTNDLAAGSRTLAQVQADHIALWTMLSNTFAMKVFQTTTVPRTTSTDSWATLGNQTALATESKRTSYNDWLRGGAPIDSTTHVAVAVGTSGALLAGQSGHPLTGYFETADAAESARNSGKWRVDLGAPTTDGVHPSAVIHAAMAAAIDTTRLTLS